jgi:MFS family permease
VAQYLDEVDMLLVMSDSSTLTAGMVAASDPALRGATMAVHSTLGFGAGFIAPLVFGLALDLAGGNQSAFAWGMAFVTLGIGAVVAPALLGSCGGRDRDARRGGCSACSWRRACAIAGWLCRRGTVGLPMPPSR